MVAFTHSKTGIREVELHLPLMAPSVFYTRWFHRATRYILTTHVFQLFTCNGNRTLVAVAPEQVVMLSPRLVGMQTA